MPGFSVFAGFAGVVEITRLNTGEFLYYLDELHANELVFAFSFVSSNNTDVKTTEQFFLLHTRYLCDFSFLTNFSPKLRSSKKKSCNCRQKVACPFNGTQHHRLHWIICIAGKFVVNGNILQYCFTLLLTNP